MKNLFLFFFHAFLLNTVCAQDSAKLVSKIDKIVLDIDLNENFARYYHYDTVELETFGETEVRIVKFELLRNKAGQIVKITTGEQGYAKTIETYYYQNNKVIKAVIKWGSPEFIQWDSEIYYDKNKAVAQIHRAVPLNAQAFMELAEQYLEEQSNK
jgi:hypothetical protein